jgi:hypothetical protein
LLDLFFPVMSGSEPAIILLGMATYEQTLDSDLNYAFREGSLYFQEKNEVHQALRRITRRLADLQIPYAVVGGMAMFAHGFRRFTEDVDILVTRESMERVRSEIEGLGYVQPAGTTTKLRDSQNGVRIEFLITGGFPGDGKPKAVSFPDPARVAVDIEGIRVVSIPTLLELKLSSGMTGGVHRLKDLADVVELIKALSLPRTTADQLNPEVAAKFLELWDAIASAPPEE